MSRSSIRTFLSCVALSFAPMFTSCGEAPSDSSAYLASVSSFNSKPQTSQRFPRTPDNSMTPGSKCGKPDTYRYGEKVPYCERNVKSSRKAAIFVRYDEELGFGTTSMQRMQFKIDHHIPLCMGGSNEDDNLWPQHSTIYELTDPAEGFLCERMSQGSLRQAQAIQIIQSIKQTPERAAEILPEAF